MAHEEHVGEGGEPPEVDPPGEPNAPPTADGADGAEGADEHRDARILYRERHVAGWPWHVCGVLLLGLSLTPLTTGVYWYFPFPLFLTLIGWLGSSVLRISVSGRAIGIHYGLLGVTLRPGRVRSVEIVSHGWGWRGFGVGLGPGGVRTYDFVGGTSQAVELRFVDDEDEERTVLFSSADPNGVVRAIEQVVS